MSALGISVGNTVLIRYLLILFISMLLFLYNRPLWSRYGCHCCQSNQLTTYTNKEKEKVLHFFAFNLLLSRDGLYPQFPVVGEEEYSRNESPSVIQKIQNELSLQNNIPRFYSINQEGEVDAEEEQNRKKQLEDEKNIDLEKSLLNSDGTMEGRPPRSSSSIPSRSLSSSVTSTNKSKVEIIWNPMKPIASHPTPPSE